jgi:hypothetical protein
MTSIWSDPHYQIEQAHVRNPTYCVSRWTSLLVNIDILHPVDAI